MPSGTLADDTPSGASAYDTPSGALGYDKPSGASRRKVRTNASCDEEPERCIAAQAAVQAHITHHTMSSILESPFDRLVGIKGVSVGQFGHLGATLQLGSFSRLLCDYTK
eukprot:gene30959-38816_t